MRFPKAFIQTNFAVSRQNTKLADATPDAPNPAHKGQSRRTAAGGQPATVSEKDDEMEREKTGQEKIPKICQ